MLARLRSFLRAALDRNRFEREMEEELAFHVEQRSAELQSSGLSPSEAMRRARIELGGSTSVKQDCRQSRGLRWLDHLRRELRHSVRSLWNSPGFTLTAILTLALCIGANLTIYAVIDAVLLRPLPFPEPAKLVTLFNTYPRAGVDRDGASITNYYERRGRIPGLASVSIYRPIAVIVGQPGATARVDASEVSPEFFRTLGVNVAEGRTFREDETAFQTDSVAILTDSYWREHFGANPKVLGHTIRVNGSPKTIVGVLPASFRFLSFTSSVYFPLASALEQRSPLQRHSGGNVIQMIGRLAPGATIQQVQSEVNAQNNALEVDDPQAKMMADAGFRTVVLSLHDDHVASVRPILLLLQAGVLVLLLIGTVNLVNLLLVRSAGRVRELAIRRTVGASGGHVLFEAVLSTTLLTLFGSCLGLIFGACGVRLLAVLGADRLPLGAEIAVNGEVALVSFVAAIALGLILAAPIAWFNLRQHLNEALKSETRGGTAGRGAQTMRHAFVVAQIALALILLTGASLLALSAKRVAEVRPGFNPAQVLSAHVSLVGNHYPGPASGLEFADTLVHQLQQQPGVVAAGVINNIPFSGNNGKSAATVKGHVPKPGESPHGHYSYGVAGEYFRAMGFQLREGRFLDSNDSRRKQRVCVVDDDFAHIYWPHQSAIGHILYPGSGPKSDDEAFTVAGVVGTAKQAGLADDSRQGSVYFPYIYRPDSELFVVARALGAPENLGTAVRQSVRQIDPELTVTDMQTMDERIAETLVPRRSPALIAVLFAALAVILTGIGIFGVLSYSVAQRTREIGVRMALGAQPSAIRKQFVLLGSRLLAIGTLFGLSGAFLVFRAVSALLFHAGAFDAVAFVGALVVVAAACFSACLVPATRAASVSPLRAFADS